MLAFYGIFTTYGFWLPNDPRGSWSKFVAAWDLYQAGGPSTKVTTRQSVAALPHDLKQRLRIKESLQRQPVCLSGVQAREVAHGFRRAIQKSNHLLWACSILPDHVHVVVATSCHRPSVVLGHLKREASLALKVAGLHPFQREHTATGILSSCWAQGCWKVFLDSPQDVERAIDYVEKNPIKAGYDRQKWSFVTPYKRHWNGVG